MEEEEVERRRGTKQHKGEDGWENGIRSGTKPTGAESVPTAAHPYLQRQPSFPVAETTCRPQHRDQGPSPILGQG